MAVAKNYEMVKLRILRGRKKRQKCMTAGFDLLMDLLGESLRIQTW